ncbi:hypothetical protein DFH07DRAFT_134875 [Mycena maculata]|uniref:Uncharacterized protein n=1 Tax=Mycena maculata TaxID=230809 RepID=A0AAD7I237_9AGAR|nr:hypothetical protein DFH07DRAFT_134875 [Mycena maculata]
MPARRCGPRTFPYSIFSLIYVSAARHGVSFIMHFYSDNRRIRSSTRTRVGATFVGSGMRPDRGAHERVRSLLSRRLQSCALVSGVFHPRSQGADLFPITVSMTVSHPPRAQGPRPRRFLSSAFCWAWSRCVRPCAHAQRVPFCARGFHRGGFLLQFGGHARRVYSFLDSDTVPRDLSQRFY